jgi:hypothetical protein
MSFGSTNHYTKSLRRIGIGAKSMDVFHKIHLFTEKHFDPEFIAKHGHFIRKNKRGYGYWIWKPYLVHKVITDIADNDILVYADAGCTFNTAGRDRLLEYIKMCQGEEANVSFQIGHTDKHWCKMDLIHKIEAENRDITENGQLIATTFIIRKCPAMVALVEKWYQLAQDYHMLDDSPSILPNAQGFIEHRHDQSIFSLLRKKGKSQILPDETWHPELRQKAPIWATRIIHK